MKPEPQDLRHVAISSTSLSSYVVFVVKSSFPFVASHLENGEAAQRTLAHLPGPSCVTERAPRPRSFFRVQNERIYYH